MRRFFFGLVTVRNWSYRCELTMPQIEIMMSDLPHTLYRPVQRKSGKPGKKPITRQDVDEAVRLNAELRERRKSKRQHEQGYTVEELFNGDADRD